nr:immunoglobulin heavy chain junction region [Mus musculus]
CARDHYGAMDYW